MWPRTLPILERGEQNVKIQTLEKIAEALEVSTFALFDFDQFEDIRRHDIVWNAISLLLEQSESDQQKALAVLEALFKPY
ncbi:XRE family transcriptional regulator [Paenibacillus elgii]